MCNNEEKESEKCVYDYIAKIISVQRIQIFLILDAISVLSECHFGKIVSSILFKKY